MCVSACPYKKVYYNWKTGKSEKCILCYPRLETGQAPACFHSCVGRIRYLGLILYDADEIKNAAAVSNEDLVEAQLNIIKDPNDPEIIAAAKANGISDEVIASAQKSPVFRFVKEWGIALPLHPEYRTVPMLFYVPPLLPLLGSQKSGSYEVYNSAESEVVPQLTSFENLRVPMRFIANMFSAGNIDVVETVYKKLMAVRTFMHASKTSSAPAEYVDAALKRASMNEETAKAIWHLTSLATVEDRFVIPPMYREMGIEMLQNNDPFKDRSESGFGYRDEPKRSW
jgi:nitrate reductase beta subunit